MARYNSSSATTTITGTATVSSPYSGAFTGLTGTAPYTVTLPAPGLFPGSTQTFYNATVGTVTLSTPSGLFGGLGASGSGTLAMPTNTVTTVTSDGTNYIVLSEDGSALVATSGSFTGDVDMNGSTVSITPSTLTMSPVSSGTLNNVAIGNTTRSSGSFTSLTANSTATLTANTASSSTSTGSLVVTGGVGVSGTIYAGGFNGNLTGTLQTAAQPNITSLGTLTGLTVTGATTITGLTTINTGTGANDNNTLILSRTGSTDYHGISFRTGSTTNWSIGQNSNGPFSIFEAGAAATTRLVVKAGGNVGIGVTDPIAKLDVRGTVSTGGAIWLGSTGDNSAYDNVGISYAGYNSGNPQVIFQPRTTPGSGVVNSTFYFKNSNGTSTANSTANNTANILVDGYIAQAGTLYAEKTFDLGYFPNTTANQVVYLNFGNGFLNGNMEVTITSTYSYQNATGILRKVFSFGFNADNSQWYPATSRVSEADGPIRDNIVIGEMEWDSTGSRYRLPIYHVVSSGNAFYAHVRALGGANIVPNITVSSFSTRSSPTTAANSNIINFPNTVNFGGVRTSPNQTSFFAIGLPADLYATSANQGVPITFRDCRLNNGSNWNGTIGSSTNNGNRFTAPIAGVYSFAWEGMYKHAGGGDITMQIFKNGAVVSYNNCHQRDGAGQYPAWSMAQVNWLGTMAVGDYVDFRMSSSADGSTFWYAGGLYNKCWGYLI